MRDELAKLKGIRRKFQGVFDHYGTKSGWQGRLVQTILLVDVEDCVSHKTVTDHLWMNLTKGFAAIPLQKGDVVTFYARVTPYTKGYRGRRENVYDHPIETDYRLSFPTKLAKKISELGNIPVLLSITTKETSQMKDGNDPKYQESDPRCSKCGTSLDYCEIEGVRSYWGCPGCGNIEGELAWN